MKTQEFTYTWLMPDGRPNGQEDPAWYVTGYGHSLVCSVTDGQREVQIFCDGEMSVAIGNDIIKDEADWQAHGIHNDAEIARAFDDGRIEWENNAWFDLYDTSGLISCGHLDCVHHALSDAIAQAEALLAEWATQ